MVRKTCLGLERNSAVLTLFKHFRPRFSRAGTGTPGSQPTVRARVQVLPGGGTPRLLLIEASEADGAFGAGLDAPYYECAVETRYGNLPVFSRQQASESRAPGPVPREEVLSSAGVEILLPEEDTAMIVPAPWAARIITPARTGSEEKTHEGTRQTEEHRLLHRHARSSRHPRLPQGRGERDPPDPPRRQVGDRPAQAPDGRDGTLQPSPGQASHGLSAGAKAYKWLVESNVLICADNSYSHRPDDPKSSFSKSYYVHCRYGKWRKWEITKPRLAAKLLLAQSQRRDLLSPKRQADTELMAKVPAALCGQNCPLPELLTALPQPEQEPMPSVSGVSGQDCQLPGSSTVTIPLPEQELNG